MRSADRHFRPHRKPDSTQLTLYSMINSTTRSSRTPAVLTRTRVSGSVGVQNKTGVRFPTARKGIGHVRLGRKRRRRRGSRKRRRSRGRRMTTAVLTSGLERIPDQLGYLVISEDGVLASAGELENDEHTAAVMMQMVRTASRFRLAGSADPPFKRMSVILEDFVYVVTVSAQKVFVVKRHNQHQPIAV